MRIFRMSEDDYVRMEDEMIGICTACGEERECTETDAEDYPCEACGENRVQGIGNLIYDHIEFTGHES